MTNVEMYQWMADPSLLTKSSLPELKQMVDEYPCFHAVRMLYLKNLALFDDVRLGKELRKMAVFIPDRRKLFMLVEGFHKNKCEVRGTPAVKQEKTGGNHPPFTDKMGSPEKTGLSPASASDYINWLEVNAADLPAEDGTKNRLKHQELIDSFIENENKQRGNRLTLAAIKRPDEKEDENEKRTEPGALEKTSLDDSYFTETLARVYIGQKRYDKALEIIHVLSLKYPEKNAYFADQIRYLEKIINIKK